MSCPSQVSFSPKQTDHIPSFLHLSICLDNHGVPRPAVVIIFTDGGTPTRLLFFISRSANINKRDCWIFGASSDEGIPLTDIPYALSSRAGVSFSTPRYKHPAIRRYVSSPRPPLRCQLGRTMKISSHQRSSERRDHGERHLFPCP